MTESFLRLSATESVNLRHILWVERTKDRVTLTLAGGKLLSPYLKKLDPAVRNGLALLFGVQPTDL